MIGGPRDLTLLKIGLTAAAFPAVLALIAGGLRLVTWLLDGDSEKLATNVVYALGTLMILGVVLYANHLRRAGFAKVFRNKLGITDDGPAG